MSPLPAKQLVMMNASSCLQGLSLTAVDLALCRLQAVLRGSVMRRSCRLSTKHEHRLLKKAEAEAADASAAEAAEEGISVFPSTVTKAIAGLATPSLPSPSMFPEDWRMVEELLYDTQVPFTSMFHSCHRYSSCFPTHCTYKAAESEPLAFSAQKLHLPYLSCIYKQSCQVWNRGTK